jgi:hypothetical protein
MNLIWIHKPKCIWKNGFEVYSELIHPADFAGSRCNKVYVDVIKRKFIYYHFVVKVKRLIKCLFCWRQSKREKEYRHVVIPKRAWCIYWFIWSFKPWIQRNNEIHSTLTIGRKSIKDLVVKSIAIVQKWNNNGRQTSVQQVRSYNVK